MKITGMERTDKDYYSRREFLKTNSLAGFGFMLSRETASPPPAPAGSKTLHIKPRYHRWHVDEGVEWLETNTGYATLDWEVPLSQAAIVLVDVWQRHYLKDTEARGERVIQQKLIPMVERCREAGMRIIHAPSPSIATEHPNWVQLVSKGDLIPKRDEWPPEKFRNQEGPYAAYQRPYEPREAERRSLPKLRFHLDVQPAMNEAVIANGEELHRHCKKEGILFLFFAGFNTNACILSRDYGTLQMSNRGYQVILIRDCTTGMESRDTQPTLAQTTNAVLLLEMFGQYSTTSDEIKKGFLPDVQK